MMVGNSYPGVGYLEYDGLACQPVKPDRNDSMICILDRVLQQIANYFLESLQVGLQCVDLVRKLPPEFKTFLFA